MINNIAVDVIKEEIKISEEQLKLRAENKAFVNKER
jgi:hypothetical protein